MNNRYARLMAACWVVLITVVVCFGQSAPPPSLNSEPFASSPYAAKVISLSGQVSVLRDSTPWSLNIGSLVQVQQIIISGADGYAVFEVSDGSTFEVYANSRVVFRKNPPNWRDLLDVLVGRIKVHIQKWGNQPNLNRVHTPTAVISVRGTTFEVAVDNDDDSTLIQVEEGEVEVRHLTVGGQAKRLGPGESIRVYKNAPLAAKSFDKGAFAQQLLRGLMDALNTAAYQTRAGGGGGSTSSGGGLSGDTKGTPPPSGGPLPPPPPSGTPLPPPPPH